MGSYGAHGITWGFARFSLDFGYKKRDKKYILLQIEKMVSYCRKNS